MHRRAASVWIFYIRIDLSPLTFSQNLFSTAPWGWAWPGGTSPRRRQAPLPAGAAFRSVSMAQAACWWPTARGPPAGAPIDRPRLPPPPRLPPRRRAGRRHQSAAPRLSFAVMGLVSEMFARMFRSHVCFFARSVRSKGACRRGGHPRRRRGGQTCRPKSHHAPPPAAA